MNNTVRPLVPVQVSYDVEPRDTGSPSEDISMIPAGGFGDTSERAAEMCALLEDTKLGEVLGMSTRTSAVTRPPSPQLWLETGELLSTLPDAIDHPPKYQFTVTGRTRKLRNKEGAIARRLKLNGVHVALFKYRGVPIAVDAACPHNKGPMDLGDIEEVDGKVCVSCPWHGFKFDVRTGVNIDGMELTLPVYPTRVGADGTVLVGFDKLASEAFFDTDF